MNQPTTVQALFHGGPVDGAVRPVECGPDGCPPALLRLGGGGKVHVGNSDEPAPAEHPTYELERDPIEAILWPYRHVETLTG